MHINLNTCSGNLPPLSPIFSENPQLSPIREDVLRKYSYNNEDLCAFRLDEMEDVNYLLEDMPIYQSIDNQIDAELAVCDESQGEELNSAT
jgi:hypothetical protein